MTYLLKNTWTVAISTVICMDEEKGGVQNETTSSGKIRKRLRVYNNGASSSHPSTADGV
jgi:hypothetical protein